LFSLSSKAKNLVGRKKNELLQEVKNTGLSINEKFVLQAQTTLKSSDWNNALRVSVREDL